MRSQIYLDYNATCPLRPDVIEVMNKTMHLPLNASSVHTYGREGRKLVETARSHIASLINAPREQIIFNSGATEGNNTVLKHFQNERILISGIEHSSVLEAVPNAIHIPVTPDGILDLDALETLMKDEKTGLVSVMIVNNETGAIQPIKEISALTHRHGALLHCDGVQAAGRLALDMTALGIDFLTLSAHKLGGPQGVGALALGLCGITPSLLHGGGQEKSARAGTENVTGIAGFGEAAKLAYEQIGTYQKLADLQTYLEERLLSLSDQLTIYAKNTDRVCNTSLFSIPGIQSETLLMAMDLENIALSNGSACSSGTVQPSHVLKAMGCSDKQAKSAIRVSMGWNTHKNDIDQFLITLGTIMERLHA